MKYWNIMEEVDSIIQQRRLQAADGSKTLSDDSPSESNVLLKEIGIQITDLRSNLHLSTDDRKRDLPCSYGPNKITKLESSIDISCRGSMPRT